MIRQAQLVFILMAGLFKVQVMKGRFKDGEERKFCWEDSCAFAGWRRGDEPQSLVTNVPPSARALDAVVPP